MGWVLSWLNSQARTQHLSVQTQIKQLSNGANSTEFSFVPSPGRHFFFHRSRLVMVDRAREKQMMDLQSGAPFESVVLTMLGRDSSFFGRFLTDAQDAMHADDSETTKIYTAWGAEWRPFGHPRRRRPLSSVVLDAGLAERLTSDVKAFVASAQWYIDRGIPYRRGYLLHGPPGCGKSSFITALAGELGYGICILNLNDRGMTDDRLAHALSEVPQQCIVLLEDIDAAFPDPLAKRSMQTDNNVTFSGLLNTLDGVSSSEDRILFMTTNHLERLDPALVRPGRVDVIQEISWSSPHQTRAMFVKFYPEASEPLVERFATAAIGLRFSMAQLQGMLLDHKNRPEALVAAAPALLSALDKSNRAVFTTA
eukprot:c3616_g1_i1.p1 GENE.c3616_g1_i1~~c3616_g1_i1.p1  ORF type:complete len:367 (-),score=54.38 c3616_g1_i1:739-1839(-)